MQVVSALYALSIISVILILTKAREWYKIRQRSNEKE